MPATINSRSIFADRVAVLDPVGAEGLLKENAVSFTDSQTPNLQSAIRYFASQLSLLLAHPVNHGRFESRLREDD